MQIKNFPFRETGAFSDLILDYLDQKPATRPFYKYTPSMDSFPLIMEEKQMQKVDRNLLVEVLKDKYQTLNTSEKVRSNIQSLQKENTFTITTAHQCNIFTGPLYYVLKIMCAINLAERLNSLHHDYHFVPVYWMGSEDHDFEEISHTYIFGKEVEWHNEPAGAVGTMHLRGMKKTIEAAAGILGESDRAKELIDLFEKAYLGHETMAGATRYLVNRLFKKYGLVIVEGNDKRLKRSFIPVMEDELFIRPSRQLVSEQADKLAEKYSVQAHAREINLFYMKEGFRERIIYNAENEDFEVINTRLFLDEEAMKKELHEHPERFSPNVILRPLYQEHVLPNLAYIGGGGELAYWLELERVFEYHEVNFPMLILRNSLMWVDKNAQRKMDSLGLAVEDLFKNEDYLIRNFVKEKSNDELSLKEEKKTVGQIFKRVLEKAQEVDPTLKKPVLAEQQKLFNSLENLEGKMLRAEKKKFDTAIGQIRALKEKLFPGGKLQERHENFSAFYLWHGDSFFDMLNKNLMPLEKEFVVVMEE